MQRDRSSSTGKTENEVAAFRLAFVLRSRITIFVNNLLIYFKIDVVDILFKEMMDEMKNASLFDEVRNAHSKFLAGVRTRCFLDNKRLSDR